METDNNSIAKCPTGISGFDSIASGGLPKGRPTLVCGSAGSGKTLFGIEFLVHGIREFNEPGLLVSFEERPKDIAENVKSLGFDLDHHQQDGKLKIISIELDAHDTHEAGEFDLEPLFMRIGAAVDAIGAKRIVIDSVENLFAAFTEQIILRSEFKRLMIWLKERALTAVITTEKGEGALTRRGIEEYLADCVVLLDLRVTEQITSRVLRITKYRGSAHGPDEYPFLIDESGIICMPISDQKLDYAVSTEFTSTKIPSLDQMLGGGIYRGSSVLISGTAGAGKSTLAAHIAHASCMREERTLYFAMEESPAQIMRNMESVGIDLKAHVDSGLLHFIANRPAEFGLEMHLALLNRSVQKYKPAMVVIDPVSSFHLDSSDLMIKRMLQRMIDLLKSQGITCIMSSLTRPGSGFEDTSSAAISSLMDAWILLRNIESAGERNRALYVIKSRGTCNSNQVREFLITDRGIKLLDVMVDAHGHVVIGSERELLDLQNREMQASRQADESHRKLNLESRRKALEAKIAALQAEFEAERVELDRQLSSEAEQRDQERHFLQHYSSERSNRGDMSE